MVELVDGGCVINGAYPIRFLSDKHKQPILCFPVCVLYYLLCQVSAFRNCCLFVSKDGNRKWFLEVEGAETGKISL